jgi:hypothetical protein
MSFPITRLRRLRRTETLRGMVRETRLAREDLVQALFVVEGTGRREPVASMPGVNRYSVDQVVLEAKRIADLRIPAGDPVRRSGGEGRAGLGRGSRRRHRAACDPGDRRRRPVALRDHRRLPLRVHVPWPLRAPDGLRRSSGGRQRPEPRAPREHGGLPRRAGASIVAPSDMMDGPRRGDPRRPRRERVRAGFDPRLLGEVRERLLRSLPRRRRERAGVRRSPRLPDGSRESARSAARDPARPRGGRGHADGEARTRLSRHPRGRATDVRRPARRLSRLGRVLDDQGGGGAGLDRRRPRDGGVTSSRSSGPGRT